VFSCKKRGLCPTCGSRRMAESARHLVEEVFGPRPVRQWVLSVPLPLQLLFASKPEAIGLVLGIMHRVIADWLADPSGRRARQRAVRHGDADPALRQRGALECPLSQIRPARTARCGRVTARRARCLSLAQSKGRRRNKARPHEAATNPKRSARPSVGNRREMATSGAAEHPSTRPNALQ